MDRIAKLKELLEKNPGDSFVQHALALEFIKAGQEQEAKSLFESLLHKNPAYTGSYYHLAKLCERLGQTTEAVSWYQKGMEQARSSGDMHAFGELRSALEELQF